MASTALLLALPFLASIAPSAHAQDTHRTSALRIPWEQGVDLKQVERELERTLDEIKNRPVSPQSIARLPLWKLGAHRKPNPAPLALKPSPKDDEELEEISRLIEAANSGQNEAKKTKEALDTVILFLSKKMRAGEFDLGLTNGLRLLGQLAKTDIDIRGDGEPFAQQILEEFLNNLAESPFSFEIWAETLRIYTDVVVSVHERTGKKSNFIQTYFSNAQVRGNLTHINQKRAKIYQDFARELLSHGTSTTTLEAAFQGLSDLNHRLLEPEPVYPNATAAIAFQYRDRLKEVSPQARTITETFIQEHAHESMHPYLATYFARRDATLYELLLSASGSIQIRPNEPIDLEAIDWTGLNRARIALANPLDPLSIQDLVLALETVRLILLIPDSRDYREPFKLYVGAGPRKRIAIDFIETTGQALRRYLQNRLCPPQVREKLVAILSRDYRPNYKSSYLQTLAIAYAWDTRRHLETAGTQETLSLLHELETLEPLLSHIFEGDFADAFQPITQAAAIAATQNLVDITELRHLMDKAPHLSDRLRKTHTRGEAQQYRIQLILASWKQAERWGDWDGVRFGLGIDARSRSYETDGAEAAEWTQEIGVMLENDLDTLTAGQIQNSLDALQRLETLVTLDGAEFGPLKTRLKLRIQEKLEEEGKRE